MYHLLNLLQKSKLIEKLDILNLVDEEEIQAFYAKTTLIDGSLLFIRELISKQENKYSYHWQTKTGKLICRWDNAPHYRQLETFPHHKHQNTKQNILPSKEITLYKVLKIIESEIKK